MIFKNLNGEEVSALQDWEKVIIVQHLATFGYPTWATGQNFTRLLQVLLGFTQEQAEAAITLAETERKALKELREDLPPNPNVPATIPKK